MAELSLLRCMRNVTGAVTQGDTNFIQEWSVSSDIDADFLSEYLVLALAQ